MLNLRNDLLDADASDVQLRYVGRKVGIAFICADDEAAVLGDRKIGTSHPGVGAEKIRSRVLPHGLGKVMHIVVARVRPDRPGKYRRNVAAQLMHCGDYNMTRWLVIELLDAFAKIGLDYLDSPRLQKRPHVTFVGQHRFALNQRFGAMPSKDVIDDLVVLAGVAHPMYVGAVL